MATNPVVSLPDADVARRALARCPLVIVSDCVDANDTLPFAHIKLPATGWSEKDGTVTNSDRHVSRQRAFMPRRAMPGPTGGSSARLPRAWALKRVSDSQVRPPSSMSMPACTALSRQFGLCLDLQGVSGLVERAIRCAGGDAMAGACGRRHSRTTICQREIFHARWQGAVHAPWQRAGRAMRRRLSIR